MKEKNNKKVEKKLSDPSDFVKVMDFIRLLAQCFLIAIFVTVFLFRRIRVVGSSMYPTLEDTEQGFSNVISYMIFGVDRFDVVIVKSPEKEDDLWVKRIVGMPGDIISYEDNVLTVNGVVQTEDYVTTQKETYRSSLDFKDLKLGEDEYFLMGDNRDHSRDSREVGVFHKNEILAKDVYIFYPFDKMKVVK